jgi:hypothetical protein
MATFELTAPDGGTYHVDAPPRELLRVECARCARCVEIQRLDAVKLYGPHAVWKDVGQRLLDDGCQVRTGRHEKDGCWPEWAG